MNRKDHALQSPYGSFQVSFSHPSIKDSVGRLRPLVVTTGMNGVSWSYNLNTAKKKTYGGEVIQILSANVGEINVKGTVRDYTELDIIYAWFKEYMFNLRTEHVGENPHPVTMSYPHRGWSWKVYVIDAPNYHMGLEVVAPEWQIVCAPFNEEDRNLLAKETTGMFTEAFNNGSLPVDVLRNYMGIYSSPTPIIDTGTGQQGLIDAISPADIAATLGNNFQRLIGAWSVGDFARFAFDVTGTDERTQNLLKSDETYWNQLFGTQVLVSLKADSNQLGGTGSGSVSGFTGAWPGDDASLEQRALYLAANGQKAGLPPELLVMASLVENNLQTKGVRFNDADSVGLFQIRIGSHDPSEINDSKAAAQYKNWDSTKRAEYWETPDNSIKWFILKAQTFKDRFSAPYDATELGVWCQDVEVSAFPDRYSARYDQAKTLIKNLDSYLNSNSTAGNQKRSGQFVYPLAVTGRNLGGIAAHHSRPLGNWQSDDAIDLGAPPGTEVYAMEDVTITKANLARENQHSGNIFGAQITMHGNVTNNNFFYTHLTSIPSGIRNGANIKAGGLIGKITRWDDNPGSSHCHIGMNPGNIEEYLTRF